MRALLRCFTLPLALTLALSLPLRAQEAGDPGSDPGGEEGSEAPERPGSDSPEAVTRARAREGFGPRKRAQAFLIPLDEKARSATGRVALALERALAGARQYEVIDLAKGLAADAPPEQVARAQEARKKMFEGHEAFGARKFPEAALRYKEGLALFAKGLADTDARELSDGYLRLGTAQKLAGDAKAAALAFSQSAVLDPQTKISPRAIDPAAEGPMLGARADVEANGTGILDVDARPAGAKILVDGLFKGSSPARLELSIGRHLVRIERTGFFPQADLVEVRGGKETPVSLTLQATPGASTLNSVIAGAVEEASRGTTGPQTSKLAEKFQLERVLVGSVSSHGMKVAIMLTLADPKQIKVVGKTDLLLVADGTDADQVEADTQSAARKLFKLDTDDARAAASAPTPAPAPAPAPTPSPSPSPTAAPLPAPGYSGMMGTEGGARRPVLPGSAAPAPAPDAAGDDPGLVNKERKVSVPATTSSVEAPPAPGPADAPPPEKPAGSEKQDDKKKKGKGLKGKSGTEKWDQD